MKKRLVGFFMICIGMMIAGCGQSDNNRGNALGPSQMKCGDTVLTYNETYTETEGVEVTDYLIKISLLELENAVILGENGEIRVLYTENDSATTYRNIRVGDDVDKIKDTFEYEYEYKDGVQYWVMFDGETEVVPTNTEAEDDWLVLIYTCEDDRINSIMIYDNGYAKTMK